MCIFRNFGKNRASCIIAQRNGFLPKEKLKVKMHALENIRFIESIGTQMENKDYYVVYDKALNKFYSHINCLIDKLKNKKKVYIFGTNTPGSMILSYLKANGVEVCGFWIMT